MRDFVEEFKKKKRDRSIAAIVTIVATLLCANSPYTFLIFVPIVGFIIFSVKMWRCPNCDLYLGKARNLKICKACGEKLV